MPQFGYAAAGTDERALEDIYQAYNGERRVVGVKSREVRDSISKTEVFPKDLAAAQT